MHRTGNSPQSSPPRPVACVAPQSSPPRLVARDALQSSPPRRELLGSGTFGAVYKISPNVVEKEYFSIAGHEELQENLRREIAALEILREFHHPNFMAFYGHDVRPNGTILLRLEFVAGVSLAFWIKSHTQFPKDRQLVWPAIAQTLIGAMNFLHHTVHLIHGDFHPGNVIINPDQRCLKIIDFGEACSADIAELQCRVRTAPIFLSPEEVQRDNMKKLQKAEVYGVGAVLFTLYFGYPPYSHLVQEKGDDFDIDFDAGMGSIYARMRSETDLPGELLFASGQPIEVMSMLLQKDPTKRATLQEEIFQSLVSPREMWLCR